MPRKSRTKAQETIDPLSVEEDRSLDGAVRTSSGATFTPPEHSRATRRITLRNRSTFRGALVDHMRGREFVYESKLERDFLEIVLADVDVVEVDEQPPAVSYRDRNGVLRTHTFDALVVVKGGRRVAVDVKPRQKVEKSGIRETQRLIRDQVGTAFADVYIVRTEDHMHSADVLDARLVSRARRLPDPDADIAMRELLRHMHGDCRLRDLVDAAGSGAKAFNAAVRLIGARIIEVRDETRISLDSVVRPAII